MINCRELCNLLIDFVANELPPEHRVLVEQHLQWCPPCMTYMQTYQLTIQMSRKLPCTPLPPELAQRLWAALNEIHKEKPNDYPV